LFELIKKFGRASGAQELEKCRYLKRNAPDLSAEAEQKFLFLKERRRIIN
jgi:hypothetical protein